MANDCEGNWTSYITWTKREVLNIPPDDPKRESDGSFVIKPHNTAADFEGTHTNKNGKDHKMLDGKCTVSGEVITIEFHRDDDDNQATVENREYSGTITTVSGKKVISGGTVKVFKGPGPEPGDTGTWEAERMGGVGFGKGGGKGGRKGHKGAGDVESGEETK